VKPRVYLETTFLFTSDDVLDKDYATCQEIIRFGEKGDATLVIPRISFLEVDHVFDEKVESRTGRFASIRKQLHYGKANGLPYPAGFNLDQLKTVSDNALTILRKRPNGPRIEAVCERIPLLDSYSPELAVVSVLTRRERTSRADRTILAQVLAHYSKNAVQGPSLFCTRDNDLTREAQRCLAITSPRLEVTADFREAVRWLREKTIRPSSGGRT